MVLKPSTSRLLIAYRWPMTLLLLAGLICASVMVGLWWLARGVQRGVEQSAGVPAAVLNELGELVDQATHVSMTQSFVSSLPMISDAGSGRLELASVERQEILRDEDTLMILGNRLSLGTSVAEIKVPVIYRYYVSLDDPWQMEIKEGVCHVMAPRLRLSLPPAIQTQHMEKKVQNGWARFNASQKMNEMEKQLTPTLVQYAADEHLMTQVRDQSRKTLSRFVQQWLLQTGQVRGEKAPDFVQIQFGDEAISWSETPAFSVIMEHE